MPRSPNATPRAGRSPKTTPERTTRRSPKRSPLQERSQSENNEGTARLHQRNSKSEILLGQKSSFEPANATPFPTKPQHIFLPSTIKKQRSQQDVENELPDFLNHEYTFRSTNNGSRPASRPRSRDERRLAPRQPKIQLKRSVTALREMYEAQSEKSRPSTAANSAVGSPVLRPMTSGSRVRSISSVSEGSIAGQMWPSLDRPRVEPEDLALLPTLSEHGRYGLGGQPFNLGTSFAARTSSPILEVLGESSPRVAPGISPYFPRQNQMVTDAISSPHRPMHTLSSELNAIEDDTVLFHPDTSLAEEEPTILSSEQEASSSSPNVEKLGDDSTFLHTDPTVLSAEQQELETSPNVLKLGTTSPAKTSSPAHSVASVSSSASRKRKASELTQQASYAGNTPLFMRPTRRHSSPLVQTEARSTETSIISSDNRVLPSSPPEFDSFNSGPAPTSSPVIRLHGPSMSVDRSSLTDAHVSLQGILTSSPGHPPPARPIIRAPNENQFEIIALQKRQTSGDGKIMPPQAVSKDLPPTPLIANIEVQDLAPTDLAALQRPQRSVSRSSAFTEEFNDQLYSDDLATAQVYMQEHGLNSSQDNMITDAERHEAADGLSALPGSLSNARSMSFLGSSNSSVSRFDSIRASIDTRLDVRSRSHGRGGSSKSRPGSAASDISTLVVPTWARKYYSGVYRNSFQNLYQSTNTLPYPVTQVRSNPRNRTSSSFSLHQSHHSSSALSSTRRRSLSQSLRRSFNKYIPTIVLASGNRPRLEVRKSHMTSGLGPLVSNPPDRFSRGTKVRPVSEMIPRPQASYRDPRTTIRRVSAPLSAVDPRFHWNGIIEDPTVSSLPNSRSDHSSDYVTTHASLTPSSSLAHRYDQNSHHQSSRSPSFARSLRRVLRHVPSAHLHHDRHLNSSSSASVGFGAPYNSRPHYHLPDSLRQPSQQLGWWRADLKDTQVILFCVGFLLPIAWFVAAVLPLPRRPQTYHDIEKQEHDAYAAVREGRHGAVGSGADGSGHGVVDESRVNTGAWDDMDVIARLRLERHVQGIEEVRWQNARWWRRMNRWMCAVGAVVLTIVVVLSVIGTAGHWS